MRVARRSLAVLVFSALFACGFALAADVSVSLTAQGPQPATVTAEWGDTVTFSNADSIDHGVNSPRAGIDNVAVPAGGTYVYHVEGRAGRYNYTQTGPKPNFSGVLEVTATGKVTLKLSKNVGVFGSTVTLSGRTTYGGTPVADRAALRGGVGDWTPARRYPWRQPTGRTQAQIRLAAGGRIRARVAAGQISLAHPRPGSPAEASDDRPAAPGEEGRARRGHRKDRSRRCGVERRPRGVRRGAEDLDPQGDAGGPQDRGREVQPARGGRAHAAPHLAEAIGDWSPDSSRSRADRSSSSAPRRAPAA